jgi:sulfur relay (sulfurtransferase) complex TusBCD TusD component (DsrE family)
MIVEELIIEGVQPGSMNLLGEWVLAADEVLVF